MPDPFLEEFYGGSLDNMLAAVNERAANNRAAPATYWDNLADCELPLPVPIFNVCQCCGGVPDICFRPVDYGDGTGEPIVIICRKCIDPVELDDYAIIRPSPAERSAKFYAENPHLSPITDEDIPF